MNKFLFFIKQIWNRQSILRAYLNYSLLQIELKGKTIDVGGGKNADYISFMPKANDCELVTFDIKAGDTEIDFEKDRLPAENDSYDTVLFLNVMEHIFNYQHIANEVVRILKPGGQMIGYVPFLMWYHPDHRDFFRYTHEAIEKIFNDTAAKNIKIEPHYCGPFLAAGQMLTLSLPRLLRPLVFSFFYILDGVFMFVKGNPERTRFIIGYTFSCTK